MRRPSRATTGRFTLRERANGMAVGSGHTYCRPDGRVWVVDTWSPGSRQVWAKAQDEPSTVLMFEPHELGLYFGYQ